MSLYQGNAQIGGQGRQGNAGKSAYEAAKEGGYTGTEAEFNEAMKLTPPHLNDQVKHITENERTSWNAKASAESVSAVSQQLGTFVRPNLLDNWYFGRPVNQRGQTEYTGEWIYTIDRWELSDGGGTLTVQDGGIIYTSASYLFQPFDSDISKQLAGKTLTISFLYADGTLDIGTSKIASSWDSWTVFLEAENARLVGVGNGRLWVLNTKAGKAIVAAKLELGPTQTLAHQDTAGNWMLNEVPKYSRELLDCQRYYVKFGYADKYCILGSGVARDGTFVSITVPVPAELRANPVVILAGTIVIRHSDGVAQTCTTLSCDAFGVSSILLKIQASDLTPGDAYEAFLGPGNYLHVGCDL